MGDYEKERWRKTAEAVERGATGALAAVESALSRLHYGAIVLTVHDGRVVQLDITEKQRFSSPA